MNYQNYYINPYKLKRRSWIKFYFGTYIVSFAIVLILGVLTGFNSESEIVKNLIIIAVMPISLAFLGLIPFICYMAYLTKRANIYEKENNNDISHSSAYEVYKNTIPEKIESEYSNGLSDLTDKEKEEKVNNISELQEIEYKGHLEEKFGPWSVYLFLYFIYPPVGLYYIFRKAFAEPSYYLENSVVLKTVGKMLLVFFLILAGFEYIVFKDADGPIPGVIYAIAIVPIVSAAIVLIIGTIIGKKGKDIALVQRLIWVLGVVDIPELASNLSLNYVQTTRKVQDYILKGFLTSCFIDYKLKKVIVPVPYQKEAIKCKACGGTTVKIKGISSVCSFCRKNI